MAWEDILKTRCEDLAVGVCFACQKKSKRTACLECREE